MLPASFFWSTPIEDSPVFFFQMVSPSIHNLASWSSPITENSYGAPATTSTPVRACQKLSEWCVRGDDDSKNRISSSKHVPFLEPFVYHDEYIGIIMSICLIWYAYRYVYSVYIYIGYDVMISVCIEYIHVGERERENDMHDIRYRYNMMYPYLSYTILSFSILYCTMLCYKPGYTILHHDTCIENHRNIMSNMYVNTYI